ncbi:MAG TPA: hypothetical protein PLF17_10900 [Chitinophagaceae bacterium]|nr:hypothetical protein [Chitinophagaceae bacterium]HRA71204.1 hypothetical protein [Flavobacterium sp.]
MISPISIATRGFLGNSLKTITIATAGFIFISGASISDNEYYYGNSVLTNKYINKSRFVKNFYYNSEITDRIYIISKFNKEEIKNLSIVTSKVYFISGFSNHKSYSLIKNKLFLNSRIYNVTNEKSNIKNNEFVKSEFNNSKIDLSVITKNKTNISKTK